MILKPSQNGLFGQTKISAMFRMRLALDVPYHGVEAVQRYANGVVTIGDSSDSNTVIDSMEFGLSNRIMIKSVQTGSES